MVVRTSDGACPFKGPEPFAEADAGQFFGRDEEIGTLLDRFRHERLTVLTAESGAGKTSLIQAGLIPALRLLRESDGAKRPGPVIYIQGRGPERQKSAAPLLVHRIHDEIKRLTAYCADPARTPLMGQSMLQADLEALRAVPCPTQPNRDLSPGSIEERDWLLRYLAALCDASDDQKLILVIDQLEELLGSGASGYARSAMALQLIGTAFLREERLQLVLSLREEYTGQLRPLDALVGALVRRTYALLPLTVASFREGVLLTVKATSDDDAATPLITESAIDRILDWTCVTSADPDAPVDALVAQAVFKDVCLDQLKHFPTGNSVIDVPDLKRYEDELRRLWKDELTLDEPVRGWIAEGAMFRHIKRALQLRMKNASDEPIKEGHVMRAAARMGASLASPQGFKRHVSDVQLVLDALREDLRTPPMAGASREYIQNRIPALRNRSSQDAPGRPRMDGPCTAAQSNADLLVLDALAAIERLKAGNVLKAHGLDEHRNEVIALQHDGFGPAFDRWGEQFRSRIEDALASRVGCFGLAVPKGSDLADKTLGGQLKTGH